MRDESGSGPGTSINACLRRAPAAESREELLGVAVQPDGTPPNCCLTQQMATGRGESSLETAIMKDVYEGQSTTAPRRMLPQYSLARTCLIGCRRLAVPIGLPASARQDWVTCCRVLWCARDGNEGM